MSQTVPKLFQPIQVGNVALQHRVVMAPLTRYRADGQHVHGDLAVEYYSQRGSVPGTLLLTEATFIAAQAGGYADVPGIWSEEQIAAWKRVTQAVHAKGSFIYLQLWALGRAANPVQLEKEDHTFPYVSSGDVQQNGIDRVPRPLTVAETKVYVELYATAASNAVHKAGFDGVEIHGANGYLIDQFLSDVTNNRTDEYGGSVENRAKFALEVINAVTREVGDKRTGIRLSPWSPFQDMRMKDPIPTYSHLITRIRDEHPDLAYIHLVEPRVQGSSDCEPAAGDSNEPFRKIWGARAYLRAGGFTRETALKAAEDEGGLIVFGRDFISNPDLALRLKKNIPLTPYNRDTFYLHRTPVGYTDYPFALDGGRL